MCVFIIHVCLLNTDGVVCVFMVMLKMLKLRGLHPPPFVLQCNAMLCISSEVMQGSNKVLDWGIKGTD